MGGAGERQGVQIASAPPVPLKHHPPNIPQSSRQAPPDPALWGGSWGEGNPPGPPQPLALPLFPPPIPPAPFTLGSGMRRWEKCNRSLLGFRGGLQSLP